MNGKIMNGSGQGLRRFRVVNGVRHWLEKPTDEWLAFEKRPSYIKRAKKTNLQTNLFENNEKTNF